MLLSKEWLKEFITFPKDLSDQEIAKRLSLATVEVEGIKSETKVEWDRIVIGRIKAIEQHPNADRLKIAVTDIGKDFQPLRIVCGGTNVAVGMSVAVALVGSRVRWHGEGELVSLEPTTIRGVKSDGMICASREIGLEDRFKASSDSEILDLSEFACDPGTPLSKAFSTSGSDTIYEIDNKSLSHRGDLWGHRDMARELGAVLSTPFKDHKSARIPLCSKKRVRVIVEDKIDCPRYMGIVVSNVSCISQSPEWIRRRLRSCGVRPINIIVDITNYVMLEYGQPMHAFDFDAIKNKQGNAELRVRRARNGESLKLLDGSERTLSKDILIIANHEKPLAIAGVMGGFESGVNAQTNTIVFESATFNGLLVRRGAAVLRLASESQRRFEKNLDACLPPEALARAIELVLSLCRGSQVISVVCDSGYAQLKTKPIALTEELLASKIGAAFSLTKAAVHLKRLGCAIKKERHKLMITVPSFRSHDIKIPEDLIEEVLRLYGFERIQSRLPSIPVAASMTDSWSGSLRAFKRGLVARGFHEVMNYAFCSERILRSCAYDVDKCFRLSNPFSDERPFLAPSLVPNLLETFALQAKRRKNLMLFEINKIFLSHEKSEVGYQPLYCAGVVSGSDSQRVFSRLTSIITALLKDEGYPFVCERSDFVPEWSDENTYVYLGCADLALGCGVRGIGSVGLVAPRISSAFGLSDSCAAFEINITALSEMKKSSVHYRVPSSYPAVYRDATFVVNNDVFYNTLYSRLKLAHALVASVEGISVYRGDTIGKGKKNISFRITYQSRERTLTSEEVDAIHRGIVQSVTQSLTTHP